MCQLQLLMLKTIRLVQQNDTYLQDTLALTWYSRSSVAILMFWCPLGSTSSFRFIKGTFPRIQSSFCVLHNIVGGINISGVLLQTCGDSDMMKFVVLALFVAGGKDLWYTTPLQCSVYQPNAVLRLWAPFRVFCFFLKCLSLSVPSAYGCGQPAVTPLVTSRVVGGVDVNAHSWPWQVKHAEWGVSTQQTRHQLSEKTLFQTSKELNTL